MRILVTGASGYLGGVFSKRCESLAIPLLKIGRQHSDEEIVLAMRDFKPTVVVHFASLFIGEHTSLQVMDLIRSNIEFGSRILEAMKVAGCAAIVTAGSAWQDYETSGRPANLYAATKNAFEEILKYYCDAYGMRAVSLRIFDSGGPKDPRPKLLPTLAKRRDGEALQLSEGKQKLHIVHVEDIVDAFILAAERASQDSSGQFEVFYLTSERALALRELIDVFHAKTGGKPAVEWGKKPYRFREVMCPYESGNRLPGWTPKRSIDRIIEDILEG